MPKEYKSLKPSNIVRYGDEWKSHITDLWVPVNKSFIGKPCSYYGWRQYRRPIKILSKDIPMTLRQRQSKFAQMLILLFAYIIQEGFEFTLGDAARLDRKGHKKNSKHYIRLAIDINLFKNGRYLRKTSDHQKIGFFWENIGGTWGGRFKHKDGNHYEE